MLSERAIEEAAEHVVEEAHLVDAEHVGVDRDLLDAVEVTS